MYPVSHSSKLTLFSFPTAYLHCVFHPLQDGRPRVCGPIKAIFNILFCRRYKKLLETCAQSIAQINWNPGFRIEWLLAVLALVDLCLVSERDDGEGLTTKFAKLNLLIRLASSCLIRLRFLKKRRHYAAAINLCSIAFSMHLAKKRNTIQNSTSHH